MPFTMRWFVTGILLTSFLILPALMLKSYFFVWDEGVIELKRVYPEHSFIEVGGKTRRGSSGNLEWRDYLLVPGFQIVRVSKIEDSAVTVQTKNEYGLVLVSTGFLIIGGLLIFVAIPYVRKHGILPTKQNK